MHLCVATMQQPFFKAFLYTFPSNKTNLVELHVAKDLSVELCQHAVCVLFFDCSMNVILDCADLM